MNLYAYTSNDPLNHTDPHGKCIEDLCIGEAIAAFEIIDEFAAAVDITAVAADAQISAGYAADSWSATTLNQGDYIYGGLPGQSCFYTCADTLAASGGDMTSLWESLQVPANPTFGYRETIGEYEVMSGMDSASGTALNNPAYGSGGGGQYYVPESNWSNLRLNRTITLGGK